MVRTYKKKTKRGEWSTYAMKTAIDKVLSKEMGYKKAASTYTVPQTTLERYIKKMKDGGEVTIGLPLGQKKTIFTPKEEDEIEAYLKYMEERLFGLTTIELRCLAYQLAVKNGKAHNFNTDKEMAGVDWLKSFLKRHQNLTIRKPEATSAARAMRFNKVAIPHKTSSREFDNFKRKLLSSSRSDLNASSQTSSVDKLEYTLEVKPLTNDGEPSARKQVRLLTNKMSAGQDDETDSEKSGTPDQLDNTSNVINSPSLCEDEFHFFGMNVAAQLRRLPLHVALQLQSEFQNTLYLARVQGQSSLPGPDIEETTNQTIADVESESVEHDVDEKDFPIDI